MAEGVGCGAVKPVTVTCSGRVGSSDLRHASVIDLVPFGLIRSILMEREEIPVTLGSGSNADIIGCRDAGNEKKCYSKCT